jgi:hypothetical protein
MYMRKKVSEDEKKKSITFTINPYLSELLDKHLKENNINKSKFIENLLEDKLKK